MRLQKHTVGDRGMTEWDNASLACHLPALHGARSTSRMSALPVTAVLPSLVCKRGFGSPRIWIPHPKTLADLLLFATLLRSLCRVVTLRSYIGGVSRSERGFTALSQVISARPHGVASY